jgi:hypothetical protein
VLSTAARFASLSAHDIGLTAVAWTQASSVAAAARSAGAGLRRAMSRRSAPVIDPWIARFSIRLASRTASGGCVKISSGGIF